MPKSPDQQIERVEGQFGKTVIDPELKELFIQGKITYAQFFQQVTGGQGRGRTHASGRLEGGTKKGGRSRRARGG